MSQLDLSRATGLDVATVSRMVRGIGVRRLDKAKIVVDYTKNEVTYDDLAMGNGGEGGLR
jgi:hypothetical protein